MAPKRWFRVGSARWPDGPPQSGVAHGFSLIPVNGVGVVVDGKKTGGNGVEGTFNKDMTNHETTFLDTQRIVRPLSQTCNHMWRAQRERVRVCAYGEVLSVQEQEAKGTPQTHTVGKLMIWSRWCGCLAKEEHGEPRNRL